jgi:hypothetical protein
MKHRCFKGFAGDESGRNGEGRINYGFLNTSS